MPALAASLNSVMLRDLQVMLILSVIAQFIILFWLFRHLIGVIGPIIVVVLAVVWSLAMMATLCMPMTMLTNIMPAFLVCVGVADAVHLQSVYRQVRKRGLINHDAIVYAVSTTGMPILFTSLTTMAGLLSFRFATVSAIGDMGTASAFGVFVAFVNSLVLLPIILSFNKRSLLGLRSDEQDGRHFDPLGWVVHAFGALSGSVPGLSRVVADHRRRWTLVVTCALFIACGYAASLLKVWHDPLSWIPGDRSIKEAFSIMDEHVGGTVSVLAVIKAKEGYTVKDRDILVGMEKLEEKVREYRVTKPNGKEMTLVGNSISLIDLVKETHKAMVPGDSNNYRIPDTQAQISQFVEQFSMKAPAERKHIVSIDDKATLMSLRTRWMEATSYGPFTKFVEQAAKKFIPSEKAHVELTGTIYSLFTTVSALIWNMMRSFGIAFCVITVLMILTLRSWKLGLIAMVPNLLPIVCILGLMGATKIPIDMANLLIASIALGIAVDDTIHFLHHWRVHYEANGDVDAAIAYSFDHSGRAMVSTTLILTAGFFVYLASSMAHMQRFGMLIGLTVIMALLIDLIVAPALLRSAYKNKRVEEAVDVG
jgi:predicted RND superfamily exporter protein